MRDFRLQLRYLALGSDCLNCSTGIWTTDTDENLQGQLSDIIDLSTLEAFYCLNEPIFLSNGTRLSVCFKHRHLLQATNLCKLYVGCIDGEVQTPVQALTVSLREIYELKVLYREDIYYQPCPKLGSGWRNIKLIFQRRLSGLDIFPANLKHFYTSSRTRAVINVLRVLGKSYPAIVKSS